MRCLLTAWFEGCGAQRFGFVHRQRPEDLLAQHPFLAAQPCVRLGALFSRPTGLLAFSDAVAAPATARET